MQRLRRGGLLAQTHPEGRYTYTMDMQRSLRPRI